VAHYSQPAPRLHIVQSFPYRGNPEEFSNRYSFAAGPAMNSSEWQALADAVIGALRPCFDSSTTFVRAYGYDANSISAVFVHDYATPGPPLAGSGNYSAEVKMPGDVAMTLRFTSAKLNSRGKKVYGRKYYHDVYSDSYATPDRLFQAQQAAFTTFGTAYMQGTIHPRFVGVLPDLTPLSSPHAEAPRQAQGARNAGVKPWRTQNAWAISSSRRSATTCSTRPSRALQP